LFIVKGIVEAHGGHAWAEAGEGGGARLCFTLPSPPSTRREVLGERPCH
jgi:signal transduction histidine kinase